MIHDRSTPPPPPQHFIIAEAHHLHMYSMEGAPTSAPTRLRLPLCLFPLQQQQQLQSRGNMNPRNRNCGRKCQQLQGCVNNKEHNRPRRQPIATRATPDKIINERAGSATWIQFPATRLYIKSVRQLRYIVVAFIYFFIPRTRGRLFPRPSPSAPSVRCAGPPQCPPKLQNEERDAAHAHEVSKHKSMQYRYR